jgi:ADP-ribose pyrophosphatase YjhB (NUDIX family)
MGSWSGRTLPGIILIHASVRIDFSMFQYCIKCAAPLSEYQEDGFLRYRCGSCGWIYYNNPRPCIAAVIKRNRELLFIRRLKPPGQGLWDFPGGFMEIGEDPETTLRREVREELGAEIVQHELLGIFPDFYDQERIPLLVFAFLCQAVFHDSGQFCSDEFDVMSWFAPEQFPVNPAFASMKPMMDAFRSKLAS